MTTEIKINPETNLPELPEGYWWEVQKIEDPHWPTRVIVGIVYESPKLHWFTGNPSKKIKINKYFAKDFIYLADLEAKENPEEEIALMARIAYGDAERKWRADANFNRVDKLFGTYPPKRLDVPE